MTELDPETLHARELARRHVERLEAQRDAALRGVARITEQIAELKMLLAEPSAERYPSAVSSLFRKQVKAI